MLLDWHKCHAGNDDASSRGEGGRGVLALKSQLLCCQSLPRQAEGCWLPAQVQLRLQARVFLHHLRCSTSELSLDMDMTLLC